MIRRPIDRRTLLRGAGSVAIGLPFLDAMRPQIARAAAAPPKRLLIFYTSIGTVKGEWITGGGEKDFTFGRVLAPLQRHRNDLTFIQGIHTTQSQQFGNAHWAGMAHLLTATDFVDPRDDGSQPYGPAGGISVDQLLANKLRGTTKFASLEIGVRCMGHRKSGVIDRMSWRGARDPVPPTWDPRKVFDRLFSDSNNANVEAAARRRQQQHSILDFVRSEFHRLHQRVGVEDQRRLDAHAQYIRELERQLDSDAGSADTCPTMQRPNPGDVNAHANAPKIGGQQMDLLAAALACDMTRVASFMWGTSQSTLVHTWLGHSAAHHSISHRSYSDYSSVGLVEVGEWYSKQFAGLIDRLKAIRESDGSTVFDNTAILWTTECGTPSSHDRKNIPYVLAGSCGGYLSTGRYVNIPGDRMHGDLLVTLINAMGFSDKTFGKTSYAQGPLTTLVA